MAFVIDLGIRFSSCFFRAIFIRPLRSLYVQSPSFWGLGGWAGKDVADVCAQLTNVPSTHWETSGSNECEHLVERRFQSFTASIFNACHILVVVTIICEIYAYTRFRIYYHICTHYKLRNKYSKQLLNENTSDSCVSRRF
jgi:hypothetical protein